MEDKPLIESLMALYQYDFSEFENTDLNQHGWFGFPYLDHHWVEEGRHRFIVRVDVFFLDGAPEPLHEDILTNLVWVIA